MKPLSVSSIHPGTCRPGQFRCGDGVCVDEDRICDGEFDCVDAADERDCDTCDAATEFRCEGGECIGLGRRCDGRADCADGTDELDCPPCDAREGDWLSHFLFASMP